MVFFRVVLEAVWYVGTTRNRNLASGISIRQKNVIKQVTMVKTIPLSTQNLARRYGEVLCIEVVLRGRLLHDFMLALKILGLRFS